MDPWWMNDEWMTLSWARAWRAFGLMRVGYSIVAVRLADGSWITEDDPRGSARFA